MYCMLYLWFVCKFPIDVIQSKRRCSFQDYISRSVNPQGLLVVLNLSSWLYLNHQRQCTNSSVGLETL